MILIYDNRPELPINAQAFFGARPYGSMLVGNKKLNELMTGLAREAGADHIFEVTEETSIEDLLLECRQLPFSHYVYLAADAAPLENEKFITFLKKTNCHDENYYVKGFEGRILTGSYDYISSTLKELKFEGAQTELRRETYWVDLQPFDGLMTLLHNALQSRFFNQLSQSDYTVSKTSKNALKIINEYHMPHLLPSGLKHFFLAPFNLVEEEGTASYSVERVRIPDLAVQLLNGAFSAQDIKRFFDHLGVYFDECKIHSDPKLIHSDYANAEWLYVSKVKDRIEQLKSWEGFDLLDSFIGNHTRYASFLDLVERYQQCYRRLEKTSFTNPECVISHGDLCPSNILYGKEIGYLKFIDPRGALETKQLYMDSMYDYAKMSHSLLGGYDSIVNGQARIVFDDNMMGRVEGGYPEIIKDSFRQFIVSQGINYKTLRILEASLFISMLPLHTDRITKVCSLALQAANLVAELEDI